MFVKCVKCLQYKPGKLSRQAAYSLSRTQNLYILEFIIFCIFRVYSSFQYLSDIRVHYHELDNDDRKGIQVQGSEKIKLISIKERNNV